MPLTMAFIWSMVPADACCDGPRTRPNSVAGASRMGGKRAVVAPLEHGPERFHQVGVGLAIDVTRGRCDGRSYARSPARADCSRRDRCVDR